MRNLRILGVLLLAFLTAQAAPAGARAHKPPVKSSPMVVYPRWHRVATGIEGYQDVLGSDSYVAWLSGHGALTLLNERTGHRQVLAPPGCPPYTGPVAFGGPWLAAVCELQAAGPGALATTRVDLYDLAAGRWLSTLLAPKVCASNVCGVDAVGTDWIRLRVSQEGCAAHCGESAELQNIGSGAVEPDPADAGTPDDLNVPSAVGHPCPAVRGYDYSLPYLDATAGSGLPHFLQLGSFVLTPTFSTETSTAPTRLQKCRTRTSHAFPPPAVGGSTSLLASPRAVLFPEIGGPGPGSSTLNGLFLPDLRRFEIRHPKGYPVILSGGVLYTTANISASGSTSDLWAATIARP